MLLVEPFNVYISNEGGNLLMATDDKNSNEATPTYSVRTTKDVTDRIQELINRTGLNSKDLFVNMVENLESKLFLETSPEESQAMQQIRFHLSRVDNVFLGMAQKVADVTADFTQRFDAQSLKHQEIMDRLNQEKLQLVKEVTLAEETADSISKVLLSNDDQLRELKERAKADKLTISILSQKVETLEIDVKSVPPLTKQIETMQQTIRESSELNSTLKRELEGANRENARLVEEANKQIVVLDREHDQKVKHLIEIHESSVHEHEQEIKRINEVNELKHQHVMLKIESEVSKAKQIGNQEQISLMREHNQLIREHAILQSKLAALIPKNS